MHASSDMSREESHALASPRDAYDELAPAFDMQHHPQPKSPHRGPLSQAPLGRMRD